MKYFFILFLPFFFNSIDEYVSTLKEEYYSRDYSLISDDNKFVVSDTNFSFTVKDKQNISGYLVTLRSPKSYKISITDGDNRMVDIKTYGLEKISKIHVYRFTFDAKNYFDGNYTITVENGTLVGADTRLLVFGK